MAVGRLPGPEKRSGWTLRSKKRRSIAAVTCDSRSPMRRNPVVASRRTCSFPRPLRGGPAGGPRPMLCLHGTDNAVGPAAWSAWGTGPTAIRQRTRGPRLCDTGSSYPLLARYQPDIRALGWKSGTLKAIWDNRRGLDLLQSLPFVKPGASGAIGHSLGGHNSVFTAVFDDRIQVIVSSCGLDSFPGLLSWRRHGWLPEQGWTQTRYMPRLSAIAAAWRRSPSISRVVAVLGHGRC